MDDAEEMMAEYMFGRGEDYSARAGAQKRASASATADNHRKTSSIAGKRLLSLDTGAGTGAPEGIRGSRLSSTAATVGSSVGDIGSSISMSRSSDALSQQLLLAGDNSNGNKEESLLVTSYPGHE
jgi:hypothetical protein